jgi:hypothetical protein
MHEDITSKKIKLKDLRKGSKVIMGGGTHFRGCAENIKTYLQSTYEIYSIVKPGATIDNLTNSATEDIRKLTFEDTVIFCGGTNDMGKTNLSSLLNSITDFICSNNHPIN